MSVDPGQSVNRGEVNVMRDAPRETGAPCAKPEAEAMPAFAIGQRLRLRNGAAVTVLRKHHCGRYSGIDVWFWVASIVGSTGRTTFWPDGHYAPECGVHPHELDVVQIMSNEPW